MMATPRGRNAGAKNAAKNTPRGVPPPHSRDELGGIKMGSMLDRLSHTLREMDREIKAEEAGVADLKAYLDNLISERNVLQKAVNKQLTVVDHLHNAGSFDKEYATYMQTVHTNYSTVRAKHKEAVKILSAPEGFAYHPAFKRNGDQFSGSAWTPPALHPELPKKSLAQEKVEKYRKIGMLPAVQNGSGNGAPSSAR